MMIDVDHFKSVNDRFGHAVGDQVLRAVADICRSNKRESDILARIGGEEFAILLPETHTHAAHSFAQRLCEEVRKRLPAIDGEMHQVTVSIGIASATPGTSGVEALLREADQALYEAKHTGRNRVCVSKSQVARKIAQAAE
jgi:diguanylate cyclase (GGDEF)-like protein